MASIALPLWEARSTNRGHDVQHSKLIAADHMMCHGVAREPGGVEKERDDCRSTVQSTFGTGVHVRLKRAVRGNRELPTWCQRLCVDGAVRGCYWTSQRPV